MWAPHPKRASGVRPRTRRAGAKSRTAMVPADVHFPAAATHHMTAAVTRTSHRMAPAMMPASTANGVTTAVPAPMSAATHGVAATMASSAAVTTALFSVGEGRDRNGEKCGKRDARKASHGWNLHGPRAPPGKRRPGEAGSVQVNRPGRGTRAALRHSIGQSVRAPARKFTATLASARTPTTSANSSTMKSGEWLGAAVIGSCPSGTAPT